MAQRITVCGGKYQLSRVNDSTVIYQFADGTGLLDPPICMKEGDAGYAAAETEILACIAAAGSSGGGGTASSVSITNVGDFLTALDSMSVTVDNDCANPVTVVGCPGQPIEVTVSNPAPDYTVLLTSIETALQAVNANTDGLEADLAAIVADLANLDRDNDGAALATIDASINSLRSDVQAVDANTDTVEALLGTLQTAVTTEGDETQAILGTLSTTATNILAKLNETCAGAPIQVSVCEPLNVTIANPAPDYTALLTSIEGELQAVNANTDGLEADIAAIRADMANLDRDDDGTALAAINTSVGNVLAAVQSVDANTDTVEALLGTLQTAITTEGDETQTILASILAKLNEPCTGSPQNVSLCGAPIDVTVGNPAPDYTGQLAAINNNITNGNASNDTLLGTIDTSNAAILAKLNETCAGSPQNVAVCPTLSTEIEPTLSPLQTGPGTTPDGMAEISFSNVGSANATVAGGILVPGASVTFTAYFDHATQTFRRIGETDYDATGTSLSVAITP